jgi:hypothetical protein
MPHDHKTFRELGRLAEEFDLEFLGRTARGHYRWRHRPSGQIIVTISNIKHHRAIDNTRRSIKRMIAGASHGHAAAD